MRIERSEITVPTSGETDLVNLTEELARFVEGSGIRSGWALVFVPGSTGAVTTIEYESGCLTDLERALEVVAPRDAEYAHNLRWGDGNGYSHVRAALVGPSLTVPVHDRRLTLGTWQQVMLCDFDNRPRQRRVLFEICGD